MMRFGIVIIGLVLVGFTAGFSEQDHSDDFNTVSKARHRRWLFSDKCKSHSDCGSNGCCKSSWFGNSCARKQSKFEPCSPHPKCGCFCQCQQGLECKQFRGSLWPYIRFYMCAPLPPTPQPTEEPGSGDFV